MQPKKWLLMVVGFALLSTLILFGINMLVDPFGVFGDKFLDFYAYNMNNNPRVAKIAYLDEHHDEYDSYIIGGSKSSSISPSLMNQYFEGASFYNMMMYGGDFYDYEKTIHYLVENYEVKNIVLHMSMQEIDHYNQQNKNINTELNEKVLSGNALKYYTKYLTLNLEHSFKKLEGLLQREFDPMAYATFVPETGAYNKSVRDVESLGTLEEFLLKYPDFNEPLWHLEGTAIEDNVAALERIKTYVESKGISFTFVAAPTYHLEMDRYATADIQKLWRGIASVTDFWDFTGYNTLSYDARNFYDKMHYRNTLGALMVQKMFSDEPLPVDDFGHYTTSENVDERLASMLSRRVEITDTSSVQVPIVMYHHLSDDINDEMHVSAERFKEDLIAYKAAGFNTIQYQDLVNYVYDDVALPDNPLLITFDDGYLSNYTLAFPLLKEYNMKAVISMIGWSVGLDYDPINQREIFEHFTWEQALEMQASGLVELQSHSYDLHDLQTDENARLGVLQKSGENSYDYINLFISDHEAMHEAMIMNLGYRPFVFTYPYGYANAHTEGILKQLGYLGSVTVEEGMNTITKSPDSLYKLKRFDASVWLSSSQILDKIMTND